MFSIYTYSCKEALKRLDDYVDRELSPSDIKRIERHLRLCRSCARKFAFETHLLHELREKLDRIDAPAGLLAKVSQALCQAQVRKTEDNAL